MGSKSREIGLSRTTSAGYRLADWSLASQSQPAGSGSREPQHWDTVKQDQQWREYVRAEWQGLRQWESKWSFLKDYDAKGRLKVQEPLPEYVSLFSDKVPNTTNQTFGSRIDSHLGQTLIRMDYQLQKENRKKKLDSELIPC